MPITPSRTSASRSAKRLAEALGDKAGIRRFASVSLPLDEALVDVGDRPVGPRLPALRRRLRPRAARARSAALRPPTGRGVLASGRRTAQAITLHVSLRYGRNPHHILEASFKAVARALRDAVRHRGRRRARRPRAPSDPGRDTEMIAVLDYGIGNLRSAQKALVHLGADARLVTDPADAARRDGRRAARCGRLRLLRAGRYAQWARRCVRATLGAGRPSSACASASNCSSKRPRKAPACPASACSRGRCGGSPRA